MPNPKNFTPHRQIRVKEDLWDAFGTAVGERNRTAELTSYMQFKVANPTASAANVPAADLHQVLVTVWFDPDGRHLEVREVFGAGGPLSEEIRQRIITAIRQEFAEPETPAARKAPIKRAKRQPRAKKET